ncbi:MAG: hypothetical protein R3B45_14925 [Bdellovibrionota bacterium]
METLKTREISKLSELSDFDTIPTGRPLAKFLPKRKKSISQLESEIFTLEDSKSQEMVNYIFALFLASSLSIILLANNIIYTEENVEQFSRRPPQPNKTKNMERAAVANITKLEQMPKTTKEAPIAIIHKTASNHSSTTRKQNPRLNQTITNAKKTAVIVRPMALKSQIAPPQNYNTAIVSSTNQAQAKDTIPLKQTFNTSISGSFSSPGENKIETKSASLPPSSAIRKGYTQKTNPTDRLFSIYSVSFKRRELDDCLIACTLQFKTTTGKKFIGLVEDVDLIEALEKAPGLVNVSGSITTHENKKILQIMQVQNLTMAH